MWFRGPVCRYEGQLVLVVFIVVGCVCWGGWGVCLFGWVVWGRNLLC